MPATRRGQGFMVAAASVAVVATQIRDLLILHYEMTERRDSPFRRQCAAMPVPDTPAKKIALFRDTVARTVAGLPDHAACVARYCGAGVPSVAARG